MDTLIRFFKRFTFDFSHAIWYAAIEYDMELQRTKTGGQRMGIWIVVIFLTLILISAIVYGVWYILDSIEVPTI